MQIDLNSDLGEGYGPWAMGDDAQILDCVTSANIACGGHAGDPETMFRTLRLAAERDELKVINDQIGAPTGADLLADVTALVLHRLQMRPELAGTYHCVAGGQTSWHGFASLVVEWARAHGRPVKVAADKIRAIPTSAYPTAAARPLNSRLATAKLQDAFGVHLPGWQAGVERMLAEIAG